MSRTAKGAHVLFRLREKLGLLQKQLAEKVGLSTYTIRDIERGVLKLTRRNAIKISEATGVSPQWLMDNKPAVPIQNIAGKRWTTKDVPDPNRWNRLDHETRRYELAPRVILLDQYLQMCSLIEMASSPIEAIQEWKERFDDAMGAFVDEYQPLREKVQDDHSNEQMIATPVTDQKLIAELMDKTLELRSGLSASDLQQIKDDIETLQWAYENPSGKDPVTRAFWKAVAEGRSLSDALNTLWVLEKTKSTK
jgi:transcriptional regulator with XRE-family HTH domain